MDYEINLSTLTSKKSELDTLKTSSEDIYNEFNSGYLHNLSGTEISTISSNIKELVERLKKGCTNSKEWYSNYCQELATLEASLANFSASSLDKPTVFSKKFEDLFSKKAMPYLRSDYTPPVKDTAKETETTTSTLETPVSPSGVISYQVGKLPKEGEIASLLGKRAVLIDLQVDGTSLGQDGSITIKRGQTVRIRVRVPDEVTNLNLMQRTSASGQSGWGKYAKAYSEPFVDRYNKSTWTPIREYDWVITGTKNTNGLILSQTMEFSTDKYKGLKGMVRLRVNIVD